MRIVLTGTPGTGKTVIAKLLSELMGLELVDIKEIVNENGLSEGPEHEVDMGRLAEAMMFLEDKDDYVVEGHLACEIRLPADFIFILRADPEVLRERLAERGYDREKLNENLMAEMLDYCTQRAEKVYAKAPLELDTSKRTPGECAEAIETAAKNKKKELDSVDYSEALSRLMGQGGATIELRDKDERGEEAD